MNKTLTPLLLSLFLAPALVEAAVDTKAKASQSDADGDGLDDETGNPMEPDADGDGIPDSKDSTPNGEPVDDLDGDIDGPMGD